MLLRDDPEVMALVHDVTLSAREIERRTGRAYSAINRLRRDLGIKYEQPQPQPRQARPAKATKAAASEPELPQAKVTVNNDGGTFENVVTENPITDWTPIFRLFNLDPEKYIVVDDTVSMSMWQQSRRTEDGERDVVNLYAYKARFARRAENAITDADLAELSARLWAADTRDTTIDAVRFGIPVTAVLNLADMQLGKGDPADTMRRVKDGVYEFKRYVAQHRAAGVLIEEVAVVNNGDPFEGIAGNYANQTHTVMRGGLRAQMKAVLDMWTWVAGEVYPLAPKGRFVSVLCNHTQFGRQGGAKDATTGDSDSGGAFLAEVLQIIMGDRFPHVEFTIPHDQMNVYATLSDVPVAFNHGHKVPGQGPAAFEKWLGGQVRFDPQAYEAKVWITAHKHHYAAWDMGSAFVYQAPSCDGGLDEMGRSKWLTDTTGQHARSGLLAMLVGHHTPMLTSDAVFL